MRPRHLHLDRTDGLTVEWTDGTVDRIGVAMLRRWSPSADAKAIRDEIAANPLAVLPQSRDTGPLRAESCEAVGTYAVRITFSDGHRSGIYTWDWIREIASKSKGP